MNHFRTKFSRYCKVALSSQLFHFIGNIYMHKHEIYQIGVTVAPLIGYIEYRKRIRRRRNRVLELLP